MLDDLITRKSLQDLAGTTTFRRGEAHFSNEAVSRVRVAEEKVSARVEGSDTYQVDEVARAHTTELKRSGATLVW
jgi:uncharacterized Zn finger protein